MSKLGIFHTASGIFALILGVIIFSVTKGTKGHAAAGWTYVVCMAVVNGSALFLRNLTGGFNTFHALALFNLATVSIGVIQVLRRRGWKKWMWRHYQYMAWSYVGLVAATSNEGFVRLPPLQRLASNAVVPLPLLCMAVLVTISSAVIFGMQRRVLASYDSKTKQ